MAKKVQEGSPFIAIPASLGGIFLVLAIVTLIFAKEFVTFLVPVAWAFVVMAFFAMLFAYKANKQDKKR